jgi:hypothetical protein
MPMKCLIDDLGAVFSASDFGEACGTVFFKGELVSGAIFDDEDVEIPNGEGMSEIGHQCVLTGPVSQFPSIAEGDPVTIRGTTYRVKFWMDDGSGVIEVHLVRK